MRHGDKIKNLSRTASHRKALLSNLACQLISHKSIVTTLAKAKENSTHQRRVVFSYLQDKEAIVELFSTVAGKVAGRPGGYTRIIKLGTRVGDNAEMALIELVDFNEVYGKGKGEAKEAAKKTRRGGSRKKASTEPAEVTEAAKPAAAKPSAKETEKEAE
jgi:large subunit ribosomal protein L17